MTEPQPGDEDVKVLKIMEVPSRAARKPLMNRADSRMRNCDLMESFAAMEILLKREWAKGRRENAAVWQRIYAEEEAEKQSAKTRKAAYATLYRFGVTPDMYAEEYRKKLQLGELELKQDYSQTIQFPREAV